MMMSDLNFRPPQEDDGVLKITDKKLIMVRKNMRKITQQVLQFTTLPLFGYAAQYAV
jgi:hypothetical protein